MGLDTKCKQIIKKVQLEKPQLLNRDKISEYITIVQKWIIKNHPDKGGNTKLYQESIDCVKKLRRILKEKRDSYEPVTLAQKIKECNEKLNDADCNRLFQSLEQLNQRPIIESVISDIDDYYLLMQLEKISKEWKLVINKKDNFVVKKCIIKKINKLFDDSMTGASNDFMESVLNSKLIGELYSDKEWKRGAIIKELMSDKVFRYLKTTHNAKLKNVLTMFTSKKSFRYKDLLEMYDPIVENHVYPQDYERENRMTLDIFVFPIISHMTNKELKSMKYDIFKQCAKEFF